MRKKVYSKTNLMKKTKDKLQSLFILKQRKKDQ
jgi:hypothetical protein